MYKLTSTVLCLLFLILLWFVLAGGAKSMRIEDFAKHSPRFDLESYFSGKLVGRGVFYDRFGKIRTTFTLTLTGQKVGDGLTLKEQLLYSDGTSLERNYLFSKVGEQRYQATANGIVGTATIVESGNALQWRYRLKQEISGNIWTLSFDDWMFRLSDTLVLNRAYAYKWGIFVGEVIMIVEKQT